MIIHCENCGRISNVSCGYSSERCFVCGGAVLGREDESYDYLMDNALKWRDDDSTRK